MLRCFTFQHKGDGFMKVKETPPFAPVLMESTRAMGYSLEAAVADIIDNVFSKLNPTSQSDMGKIMGALTPLVKGKTDMGIVSKIVKEKLSNL